MGTDDRVIVTSDAHNLRNYAPGAVTAGLLSVLRLLIFMIAVLGWGLCGFASAAIINQPMTDATAPGWVIGGSAYLTASTGADPAGDGWLRLTDLGGNEAGYAYLDTAFDISQGVIIQFDYVTWGGAGDGGFGCGTTGADGYSIFLFDGAQSFSVGGSGGSLGYANNSNTGNPGLSYGYIGTGIDEWGNFSNPTEARNGGPGGRCNAVAVRGPYNHPTGAYYYLGGTASSVAQLAFPGQAYRPGQIGTQYRKVLITLTPQAAPNYLRMDVYLQTGYDQPMLQVLNGLMVGRPVPATVKIGYAASTGGSNNYHEIRNLIVDPLPSSDIDLTVAKIASAPTVTAGGPISYTVTVRNNGPSNVTATSVPINDTVPSLVTGVTWTCTGAGGATCGAGSGSGNTISTSVTLPLNGYATYAITGTIDSAATPGTQITNTATLTVPGGITDYNANNNTNAVTVSVTAAPISISGMVYSDNGVGGGLAHNGVRDGTEASTAQTMYAKLFRAGDLTTALQVYAIGVAGTYVFNNVTSYDDYMIIISNLNSTNYDPAPPNNNWVYTNPANYMLNVSAGGSNLTNQNFGLWNGARVGGKVIKDDGLNGALANANDGVLNAAETGIAGVQMRLTNNTGGTCHDGCGTVALPNIFTDSGGNFALFVPAAVGNGVTLRIYEIANPTGYLSVSYNAGTTTGGAYTIGGEYFSFTYTQWTDYTGVLFGDVPNATFTPTPQAQNGLRSSMVYYAHTLTPGSGGSVTVATNGRTTTPAAPAWAAPVYYRDAACNGVYDVGTDTVIGGALTASAGTPICILAAIAIPAGSAVGTTDALTIWATFTFTNSVGPVVRTYDVTDTTTVVVPNLSTSTKDWIDTNGGDQNPTDTLQYTITLIESAGFAASGVSVSDTFPATLTGLTIVSCPTGTCNIASGVFTVSNASVDANGTAAFTVSATIAGGTAAGTLIDNCATVTNPGGTGAAPCASTVTVSGSSVPMSGNKPLYLYQTPIQMTRTPNTQTTAITIATGGSQVWSLSPALQLTSILSPTVNNNVPVYLVMRRGTASGNRSITVSLQCSSGGTTLSQTQTLAFNNTRTLYTFNLPLGAALTCFAGNTWDLTVTNNDGADSVRFYPYNAGPPVIRSYANLPTTTVINVDSIAYYDAAYSAGSAIVSVLTGSTVYIRSVISDPFGSFDITGASIIITDPTGSVRVSGVAMTQVDDSFLATKTYEYAYAVPAGGPAGSWTVRVIGAEGTEVAVSDYAQTALTVVVPMPNLLMLKSVQAFSDPVLGVSPNAKAIPGAVMQYTVTATNQGPGAADSVVITDPVPTDTSIYLGDLAGAGSGPVAFANGATPSGLTYTFSGLGSGADSLEFYEGSGNLCTIGGSPCDLTPDGNGYNDLVRSIRIVFGGGFSGASGGNTPSFTVQFRVKVK
jgi:uncharacterized repeat protein (TIGR01451 family)